MKESIPISATFNLSPSEVFTIMSKLEISKQIHCKMKEKNISLKTLSKKTGVKKKKLRKIFMGDNYKIEILLKVLNYLNMNEIKLAKNKSK